ncbi:MAG: right-handed parallel beta-helix repeat-containing protein [Ignavibacteriales bacterium]|nr:right-handed parallel beta-helix repeat-containing protein [Ignavibacteriales bacterium]
MQLFSMQQTLFLQEIPFSFFLVVNMGFDIRTSGTQAQPIVFKTLSNDVTINIHNPITNDGINIEGANWIEIKGFNVINQPRAGIRVVLSDFVKIINNICTNNYKWGIFTGFTNDILIKNNSCSYSQDEHGIYISNSSDRPTIINNHSFNNNGCGVHMNGDLSMGGDGIISNAIVAGNIIHDNGYGGGSAINMDCVQDSKIFNNVIYNNHATGIAMYQIDGAEGSKNNKIFNNTIVHPTDGRWAILIVNGSTGNTVYNNILINNHSFRGSICIDEESKTGFVSDYNLLENRLSDDDGNSNISFTSWQALGYDTHSQVVQDETTLFVATANSDYHLLQSSQPINIGTPLVSSVVNVDLDGIVRPQGIGYDIGAYELHSATGIDEEQTLTDFLLYQNYPNPFNPRTKISWQSPVAGYLTLKVFDVLGNEVVTLMDEFKPAGNYEVEFNPYQLSSGIYFYRIAIYSNILQTGSIIESKKCC